MKTVNENITKSSEEVEKMDNIKMCQRCQSVILSNLNSDGADYFRHISVKYCSKCRDIVNREKNAERVKRYKERKKLEKQAMHDAELTQVKLLQMENNKLLQDYIEICNILEMLKSEVYKI